MLFHKGEREVSIILLSDENKRCSYCKVDIAK